MPKGASEEMGIEAGDELLLETDPGPAVAMSLVLLAVSVVVLVSLRDHLFRGRR